MHFAIFIALGRTDLGSSAVGGATLAGTSGTTAPPLLWTAGGRRSAE